MRNENNSYRLTTIILMVAAVAAIIYVISLKAAYPVFQMTRLTDPLAELNSLLPLYYVSIVLMAVLAAVCFLFRVNNRGIHILIVLLMAGMLWYTRYYLAGFTWEPDSARNLGVSLKIPEILNGAQFQNAGYASEFPLALILEYTLVGAFGASNIFYLHLIPLVNIIIYTLLIYTFASRMFSPRAAFLTTFLSLIGMHYANFIMGEHTVGLLLLMTFFTLFWHRGAAWKTLAFLLIPVITVCHPISPILMGVFLGAVLVVYLSRRDIKGQAVTAAMLALCMIGWFVWPIIHSMLPVSPGVSPIGGALLNEIIPGDLDTARRFILGNTFIYSDIYTLNKAVYVLYALLVITAIGAVLVRTRQQRITWSNYLADRGGLSRPQWVLVISAPVFIMAAILMSEHDPTLLERGLTMAILAMAGVTASIVTGWYDRAKTNLRRVIAGVTVPVLILLTLAFPVITYSIDAYSGFPVSEEKGLEFVADNFNLKDKVFVSGFPNQMTLFQPDVIKGLASLGTPKADQGDVFLLSSTAYYYAAMRLDLSFTDNHVTRFRDLLNASSKVKGVYVSPTTAIFVKEP
jgi:hypothetical protein